MKIFNWVHRRFNNKENAKKNGVIDKQEFEDEKNCNNVFECWGGGILTIGTFGYDPLIKDEQMKQVCNNFLHEEELQCADYEIISGDKVEVEIDHVDDDEDEEKPMVFGDYFEDLVEKEEIGFEYVMMEKTARTTLADLFTADSDSDDTMKKQPSFKKGEIVKQKSKCKGGASFAKKLKLEEAPSIHKLNRLMRRMLKRKIHPAEIGVGVGVVINPKVPVAKKCNVNDHASLLQPPDAII